jgi:hypothetical protein
MNPVQPSAGQRTTLLLDPLDVQGAWKWPEAAGRVLVRMRDVCLLGVRLLSDRQPDRILVDDHTSGGPAIWLHNDGSKTAWIIVNIGGSDWCNMCYQFGHELGHVLCNSWGPEAKPQNPCQWIEEALVEAFSLRGLGLLATSWERDPPFRGNEDFAKSIREYRLNLLENYMKLAAEEGSLPNLARWFRAHRSSLETQGGVTGDAHAAILIFLAELERNNDWIESLGALNRWPERTGLPIQEFFAKWQTSCAEIKASPKLPNWLTNALLEA